MSLLKELREIFDNNCSYYEDAQDIIRGYNNGEFTCSTGCVGELIYYHQTRALFEKYPVETLQLIQDIKEDLGYFEILKDVDADINIDCMITTIFEYYVSIWINEIEEE